MIKTFKRLFSTVALSAIVASGVFVPVSMTQSAEAATVSAIAPAKNTTITKKVTKTSLNVRKSATTKSKKIKTLKKGTVLSTTGKKSGKWIQIKVGKGKGWVHSSYVINKKYTVKTSSASASSKTHKATSSEQKAWTAGLPKACKNVPIKSLTVKNPSKKSWSVNASTKMPSSKVVYFTISVNGNLSPSSAAARALMKHECGHVLMGIYSNDKGKTTFRNTLSKGWPASNTMRVENAADCIADQLGAKRSGNGYTIGYGTKCNAKQKSVAKTIANYSKNKSY